MYNDIAILCYKRANAQINNYMKKVIKLLIFSVLISSKSFGQLYATQSGETSFFSETPMENISAINKTVGAILNTSTNEVADARAF
jgi:hypothetical protein